MSSTPFVRRPVPVLVDRDHALDLVPHEPAAEPVLTALLDGASLPRAAQAVVLSARLGGLARAFAHRYPSWLVTCVDPSVALLSASLDALRPAGLSCQLTVMQSRLPELPLEPGGARLLLGDLPLARLQSRDDLTAWAGSVRRALQADGSLHLRIARTDAPESALTAHLATFSPAWAAWIRSAWSAAFPLDAVTGALSAAGLHPTVRSSGPLTHLIDARP